MDSKTDMEISIIIPCYNEEGNITELYKKIKSILDEKKIEFIFIDDNSKDSTLSIIEKLADNDKTVKYVSFSRNFGHQSALRAGLEKASGNCVITMDADLQHPPEVLKSLFSKWEEGYDIVYTIRRDNAINPFKRLSSAFFYKFSNYLSDVQLENGSADFRLLDKKIVDILVNDISEYHLFYRGLVSWVGFKQIAIEYNSNKRFTGKTKYSFGKMLSFAANGITSFSVKPLRYAVLMGVFISFITAIYSIYILYVSIFTDKTIEGWTSVILSVLFIGGVNMILLGIIGEYIGKIFMQSKNRPHYLVKKTNIE
jgi:dolichol-phosphate mannosyltransferase